MRTLPATVTMLATAMVLTGCGGDRNESGTSGSGQGIPARPVIVPEEELVSAEDSGDLPEATARVAQDCQGMSTTRDFDGTARRMSAVASGDGSAGAKALAKVCLAAARANQGRYRDSLDAAEEARTAIESPAFAEEVPEPTVQAAKKFVYRTVLYSASAVGDTGKVQEARTALEKLGGVSAQDLKNACSVAADPASLPDCASAGPSSSPATEPPGKPTTTEDETDQPPTGPVEPAESGTDSTDGPVDTNGPVDTDDPTEPTDPTDEGDSIPDDGPAPAES